MGVAPEFLLDKSAFARLTTEPSVASVLDPLLVEGVVAVCGVLLLEAGHSARSAADHRRVVCALRSMPEVPVQPADWDRAIAVQGALAERGMHRSAGLPDLLTAAAAERSEVIVLHYDSDFDLVAQITGQKVRWVVPKGSV